ncbi:CdiA family toxin C-terminal domain-containing protein, partial [Paenibacillus camerounensis]|uniref:CdiA family toxin C-terminal domain-containing protein n=1 Tax=Paenibacillus camerounensis TaxID=1243663 RepID=UPI001AE01D1D
VRGVQGVQAENKRQADQLSRQLGVLAGLFGIAGSGDPFRPVSIPTLAQKAVTSFIRTLSILSGRDELSRDPAVQKLRGIIQQSGLASIEGLSAQVKLKEIYEAREQIAKAQTAYEVYQTFGNQAQMAAAHQQAEEARRKLESMGISAKQYEAGKDLTGYFRQAAIKACDYDPSVIDKSVPLPEKEEYAFLLRMAMEPGIQGEWAKQQLALVKPEATLGPVDPYNSVSEADILNRNDPEAIGRLKETYWYTLPPEEQDRRYEELKAYYEKQEKEAADKNRLTGSGVGNQTLANILVGGSNMIVNAIDTASFGIARTVTDWIAGPKPEGYVSPLDDPYGKKAGQVAGGLISIGLPWKYLGSGMQATGRVGKFSPTLYKSMVSGAISGTVGEAFDAINDYRDDGKQSLGERIISVGVNTVVAGAGDVIITSLSKGLAGVKKIVNGSIPEAKVKEVEATGKAKADVDAAAKELEDVRVGGTGNDAKIPRTGAEWDEYFRSKYGDENVTWVTKNKFEYVNGFDDHMINAQGLVRKGNKGVVGGHNLENFEKILTDQGWKLDDVIVSRTPHSTVPGVYEIEYRLPALDRELKVVPGQYKNIPQPKTVYDSNVISNEQMLVWGKEAMANGVINGRLVTGYSSNGLRFTGYLDDSGNITNFHPSFEGK